MDVVRTLERSSDHEIRKGVMTMFEGTQAKEMAFSQAFIRSDSHGFSS